MIKLSGIKAPAGSDFEKIKKRAALKLGIKPEEMLNFSLQRLSVDARRKSDVHLVCSATFTVENEEGLLSKSNCRDAVLYKKPEYNFPVVERKSTLPPVVIGMGPAGLFAALELARAGLKPVVLERGKSVEHRTRDVERFWNTGILSESSNVQFGEGGAGAFSDGKLSTGINDKRISHVFETFVSHGAPVDIMWSNKPHVGTDVLREVISNMRQELLSLGADIRFSHRLEGICTGNKGLQSITAATESGEYEMPCDALVLAPGHSARDSFEMLHRAGVPMTQKAFAVGLRIEHRQRDISVSQFGDFADRLPPADYKLACHLPSGRSAYSFCVCPGGQVIAAASEQGRLVTNGMSLRARDGENINGGFLVGVGPGDFLNDHPLSGVEFQKLWEERAFALGGGDFCAPIQQVGDFLDRSPSKRLGAVTPTYKPGVRPCDLRDCLPSFVSDTLASALPILDRSLHGFAFREAILTGIESRSSSPVRILRGEDFQSPISGIYPCGEGAGYAGGITSAAVDGIKVAEKIAATP